MFGRDTNLTVPQASEAKEGAEYETQQKRGICAIDQMKVSKNEINDFIVDQEYSEYSKYVTKKAFKFIKENPGFPEESYPSAMFFPEILYIRKKEGQKP